MIYPTKRKATRDVIQFVKKHEAQTKAALIFSMLALVLVKLQTQISSFWAEQPQFEHLVEVVFEGRQSRGHLGSGSVFKL